MTPFDDIIKKPAAQPATQPEPTPEPVVQEPKSIIPPDCTCRWHSPEPDCQVRISTDPYCTIHSAPTYETINQGDAQ